MMKAPMDSKEREMAGWSGRDYEEQDEINERYPVNLDED